MKTLVGYPLVIAVLVVGGIGAACGWLGKAFSDTQSIARIEPIEIVDAQVPMTRLEKVAVVDGHFIPINALIEAATNSVPMTDTNAPAQTVSPVNLKPRPYWNFRK